MRAVTLCFTTDFCSGDHKPANKERVNEGVSVLHQVTNIYCIKVPKSEHAQLINNGERGLYARHCMASLCLQIERDKLFEKHTLMCTKLNIGFEENKSRTKTSEWLQIC